MIRQHLVEPFALRACAFEVAFDRACGEALSFFPGEFGARFGGATEAFVALVAGNSTDFPKFCDRLCGRKPVNH